MIVNKSTRKATIRFLFANAIAPVGAAWLSIRYMHSPRSDGPLWGKIWLALCAISVLLGTGRFLYYRNRRDYFSEEMDHRSSLAKGPPKRTN